jgi:hypothetical protein
VTGVAIGGGVAGGRVVATGARVTCGIEVKIGIVGGGVGPGLNDELPPVG